MSNAIKYGRKAQRPRRGSAKTARSRVRSQSKLTKRPRTIRQSASDAGPFTVRGKSFAQVRAAVIYALSLARKDHRYVRVLTRTGRVWASISAP